LAFFRNIGDALMIQRCILRSIILKKEGIKKMDSMGIKILNYKKIKMFFIGILII
jgi:hypothetical protein